MSQAGYRLRLVPMMKNLFHILAAAFFALASSCSGCFGCAPPGTGDGGNLPSSCVTAGIFPEPQKLDVLFVIDNSISMKDEQEGVARELTAFIDELKKGGGVSSDFHVGVITTSVYQHTLSGGIDFNKEYPAQSGKLQPVPDADPDGGVILGTGTERLLKGDDPKLAEKFARLVQQGIRGSGQETPFEALRLALTDLNKIDLDKGGNAGFLRDGARLLIVVLTDEDDCSEKARPSIVTVGENPMIDYCGDKAMSLTPVSEYHRIFTEELKDSVGNTREVIWTVIAPVGRTTKAAMSVVEGGQVRNIDCPTSNEPGFRHRMMAEKFDPSLINLDSICRDSYRDTLLLIAGLANVTQTLEVRNVPDPKVMKITLIRKDSSTQTCTISNGGLSKYEAGKVFFAPTCKRRADDRAVDIKMLCVN
jgi:hypothetical protein